MAVVYRYPCSTFPDILLGFKQWIFFVTKGKALLFSQLNVNWKTEWQLKLFLRWSIFRVFRDRF